MAPGIRTSRLPAHRWGRAKPRAETGVTSNAENRADDNGVGALSTGMMDKATVIQTQEHAEP